MGLKLLYKKQNHIFLQQCKPQLITVNYEDLMKFRSQLIIMLCKTLSQFTASRRTVKCVLLADFKRTLLVPQKVLRFTADTFFKTELFDKNAATRQFCVSMSISCHINIFTREFLLTVSSKAKYVKPKPQESSPSLLKYYKY